VHVHVHVHVPYERHGDKVMEGKEWMHASSLIMALPALDLDQHAKVMSRIVENLRGGGGNVPRIDQVSTPGGMAVLHASPSRALSERDLLYITCMLCARLSCSTFSFSSSSCSP
jgi:hypothetical protein